ncbi:hypothetical protein D623_10017873 [Myotis brandtii]|uniref:Uncharacterized protein n=1 Tax=Myotis brandtii TaxID=109478 RepID=S7NPU8_MYOBR|nr:hypothetical protein D623_10017873 [Myotis brandtii]
MDINTGVQPSTWPQPRIPGTTPTDCKPAPPIRYSLFSRLSASQSRFSSASNTAEVTQAPEAFWELEFSGTRKWPTCGATSRELCK